MKTNSDYDNFLIEKILDPNKWPNFPRPEYLNELNKIARDSYAKNSIEGYLASVLIWHQLSEEIIKLLVEYSNFLIQVAIWPTRLDFKKENNNMYGNTLSNLRYTVNFMNKEKILTKCEDLNKIRINFVHKLTLKSSVEDIKNQAKKASLLYKNILSLFEDADDDFKMQLHDYKESVDWGEMLDSDE